MIGARRAHAPRAVGGRRGHGPSDARQKVRGKRMGGNPQSDAVKPSAGEIANRAARRGGNDKRQRSGPERCRQRARAVIEYALRQSRLKAGNVRNQRVEPGPLLCGINTGNGSRARRVGSEPVHGFGREGDESAVAQELGRAVEASGIGRETLGASGRTHIRSAILLSPPSWGRVGEGPAGPTFGDVGANTPAPTLRDKGAGRSALVLRLA